MRKFIKTFASVLLFCSLAVGVSLGQEALQKVRINTFEGGMNTYNLEDMLKPNQGASMVNVVINRLGKISKRKGQDSFCEDVGSTAFTGIGRFDPDANTSYLVVASGTTTMRALSSDTTWTKANIASPVTAGKDTEYIQANDLLFALNGYDPTGWYNGASWETAGAYPTSPPTASTGAWLDNYLFLAGATNENDWLYFSNNLEPDLFDATDVLKINTGDGQKIQHLEPYREHELIVYKERSIFLLDISGDTVPDDWTVKPISTVVGTIAPRSVVSLGNDQWFLSGEPFAVRSLIRTEFDKILLNMLSQPIQDVFDGSGRLTINRTYISKAAAVLFDNKYIIAIPTGTSTVNNTVFVYDFLTGGWYRIDGWYPVDWVVFDNRLFYIDANDGSVIECFTGTIGDYGLGPFTLNTTSDPQQGAIFDYISKTVDFDQPELFKQLDSIEVELDPTGNYDAIVYTNLDGDGWASAGSVNLAGNSLTLDFDLPTNLGNAGLARKTFQFGYDDEFKKMQVRVKNEASMQNVTLQRITIFSDPKTWRRE